MSQTQTTQTTQTQIQVFEVPSRILDIIRSFVDSSTKREYYWNRPPYRKVLRDGSYWEVYELKDKICLRARSWRSEAVICTDTIDLHISVYTAGRIYEMSIENAVATNVVLVAKCRVFKVPVFEVFRKLLYYNYSEQHDLCC
ncbi:MAG: hypothetical protein QXL19_07725 [Ignisphaera sp.]